MNRRSVLGSAAGLLLASTPAFAFFTRKPKITRSPYYEPQLYERLGIHVEDASRSRNDANVRVVEDAFVGALLGKGYVVASPEEISALAGSNSRQRQRVDLSALATQARSIELSAIVGITIASIAFRRTEAILYVGNDKYINMCDVTLSLRMLSAENGQMLVTGSHTGASSVSSNRDPAQALQKTATELAEAFPGLFPEPEPKGRRR